MSFRNSKVVIVGAGNVGSTTAFSIVSQGLCEDICLIDINKEVAVGQALDMQDDVYFMNRNMRVHAGGYEECSDADIVVITAAAPMPKDSNDRLEMLKPSLHVVREVVQSVMASGFNGIFVVSANPVDILTTLTQKLSGFPKKRVIGTGTSLDSARLRVELAKRLQVPIEAVNAWVLGEHGDSSFENFSSAVVNGKPLLDYPGMTEAALDEIEAHVREKGGEIIGKKGATYYGVAMMLAKIVAAILENNDLALPLSAPLHGEYGIKDEIYLGTLAIINGQGISHVLELPLNDSELAKMRASAATMKATLDSLE